MNIAFLAFIRLAKLLYPFIKESILGQDSVLTILRKRKVFVFVVVSNLTLFLTNAFLAEQNFILLDRLKALKGELVVEQNASAELTANKQKLLGLLHGDMDEICFEHVFGVKENVEDNGPETSTTNTQPSGDHQTVSDEVEQNRINEE